MRIDGLGDIYDVEITSDKTIPVEDILNAVETVNKNQYQEDLTEALSRELPANVRTVGYHSCIKIECEV